MSACSAATPRQGERHWLGDAQQAVREFDAALGLWRGEAFAEVADAA